MQSVLRALNIILSPALTLYFAAQLERMTTVGGDTSRIVGGAAAGLVVLAIELALTQGPRHSAWLRRWLDPRAAFEGLWLQDVFAGQHGNRVGLFLFDYQPEDDSYAVHGHAYAADGQRFATWHSQHMFIDKARLMATYLWEGELLVGDTPEQEKAGLTDLDLERPPSFSLPLTGEGQVRHVGEGTRVKFQLQRVTPQLLKELQLPFGVRELRLNAHDERRALVEGFLRGRRRRAEPADART
jgi:hypothetical protein